MTGAEIALIAGVVSAGATVAAGVQQQSAGKAQQQVATQAAESERRASNIEQRNLARRNRLVLAKQNALASKSGLTTTGSLQDTITQTAAEQERDLLLSKYNSDVSTNQTIDQGRNAKSQGDQALFGSVMQATATAASTGAQVNKLNRPSK
jgi:hypothetical protein